MQQDTFVKERTALAAQPEQDEDTIDLLELALGLLAHWTLIAATAVVGAVLMALYTFFLVTPMYKATATIYVVSRNDSVLNFSDLQVGSELTSDYIKVFEMWEVHEKVISNLDLDYTYTDMASMLSVTNTSDTRMLDITVTNPDPEEAAAIAKYYAEKSNQDIALHYDHGFTIELVKKAIDVGFTSVMIDGSSLPFEENVAKTKEIVAYAHERNVTVEAEIGHVGEGDSYHVEGNTMLTTPEEAKKFVEQTGVDSLAVSIGTAHGEYKGIPHLNFERLQEIATEVSIPLVLHGGSGSGDENLSKAVELGIAKVNICTDLLNAARDNTKDGYAERSYYDSVTLAKDGFKDCLKHYYEVFHTK